MCSTFLAFCFWNTRISWSSSLRWTEKHSLLLDARGSQGILWSKRKNISYKVNFSFHLQHCCKQARGGPVPASYKRARWKVPHFAACYNFAQQMAETNGARWCHRSHLVGAAFPVHLTGEYWIQYGDGTGHRPLVILTKSHWPLVWTSDRLMELCLRVWRSMTSRRQG